jgi:hypothetical protein
MIHSCDKQDWVTSHIFTNFADREKKKRKEVDKFEEKLMFTVKFNLIQPVMN